MCAVGTVIISIEDEDVRRMFLAFDFDNTSNNTGVIFTAAACVAVWDTIGHAMSWPHGILSFLMVFIS